MGRHVGARTVREAGGLVANTHLSGVLSDAAIEQLVRNATPIDCIAGSGSIVAMRPLTVHASSQSVDDQPRRVLHVEYAATMDLGADIHLAVAIPAFAPVGGLPILVVG